MEYYKICTYICKYMHNAFVGSFLLHWWIHMYVDMDNVPLRQRGGGGGGGG